MSGRQVKAAKIMAKAALEGLRPLIDQRLDSIEEYVKTQLGKMETRNKGVQGWIVNEVKTKIQNDLFNMSCTIDAVVEVLAAEGVQIPDFAAKVDAKKTEVSERRHAAAAEKFKAETEKRIQEAQQADEAKKAQESSSSNAQTTEQPAAETAQQSAN